jgi:hypothetical protein
MSDRWQRIKMTHLRAQAARCAVPGVPLKDVCYFELRNKECLGAIAHRQFCRRDMLKEITDALEARYPVARFSLHVDSDMSPFQPRKGEPTFKQWLAEKQSE